MSTKTLKVLSTRVGITGFTSYDGVCLFAEKHIWTCYYNNRHILQLQKQYGTGNVDFLPNLCLIVNSSKKEIKGKLLIINSAENNFNLDEVVKIVSTNFNSVEYKSDNIPFKHAIDYFSESSFVIINGSVRDTILYGLLASLRPFIILDNDHIGFQEFLKMGDLDDLSFKSELGISKIVNKINEVFKDNNNIRKTIKEFVSRSINITTWVHSVKAFENTHFTDKNLPIKNDLKFQYVLCDTEYKNFSFSDYISQALYKKCTRGGIQVILNVKESFISSKLVLLHPWIGIFQSLSDDDINLLFESNNFITSFNWCLTLMVYSKNIKNLIMEKMPEFKGSISVIKLISLKQKKLFNYDSWIEDPEFFDITYPNKSFPVKEHLSSRDMIKYESDDLSLNPNRIAVINTNPDKFIEKISLAISHHIPIVCMKTEETKKILGSDYPFYNDEPTPKNVVDMINKDNTEIAYEHIKSLCMSENQLIDTLFLKNDEINNIIINYF